MATGDFKFIFHHLKNGQVLNHAGMEQRLITCNVTGPIGEQRPDGNDVIARLTSNGKLRGDSIQIVSYVRLDRDQDNLVNLLS